ncbi:hypothetical protein A3W88_16155 [Salmonella enterica subsp. enterica serovar Typhimurium]|nr:hypothetical protein [Salmonella enterica subsp. enterica serovar Typhimurium]
MGSNIIELAKLGHERAAELKASCGAVDVRSLAQLISDLATQLEVQLVRGNALAAENAGLKNALEWLYETVSSDCVSIPDEKYSSVTNAAQVLSETPATDAFLAEVRAQARNEGINYAASRLAAAFNHGFVDKPLSEVYDVVRMILTAKEDLVNDPAADGLSGEYAEKSLVEFAAQLRQGAEHE